MLDCPLPALYPIRNAARQAQQSIADRLKHKHCSRLDHHLIDQLVYASWVQPSTSTKRLWLGLWTIDTLTNIFPPAFDMLSPLSLPDRYRYLDIIKKLLAPLNQAYCQMIALSSASSQQTSHRQPLQKQHRRALQALFPQFNTNNSQPSLNSIDAYMHTNNFTFSDSAFRLSDADVGII